MNIRKLAAALTVSSAIVGTLTLGTGGASAAVGNCPSSVRATSDRVCYYASSSDGWVAFHAYTGSDGHDYSWANGYANTSGQNSVEILDSCPPNCGSIPSDTRTGPGPLQVGSFGHGYYDGPGHSEQANLWTNWPDYSVIHTADN